MRYIDLTFPTPAANLALDEALLERCEENPDLEVLRFWTPCEHFVVIGYANRLEAAVNVTACEARGVPVFRRISGGGAVLLGPGCLNCALVLQINRHPSLSGAPGANRYILDRHRQALGELCGRPFGIQGNTDLTLGDRKFSGNSQRRTRSCVLFHGAFLLGYDAQLMELLLPMPSNQPAYRRGRRHSEFLTVLDVSPSDLKRALMQAWDATTPIGEIPAERVAALVQDKYNTAEWNTKF